MSAAKKNDIPANKVEHYDRLIATNPEVERKGASVPYTSVNGHMFSYLNAEGSMALKLPKGEREAFLERYQSQLFEAYGIIQKEFVTVPDDLLPKTQELKPYFDLSYESTKSLKPKQTKKRG